ncbi:MAG: hypothetical protein RLZZ15_540 [Verrucomicrobiota bacterium]|jgi:acetyl esterase/lipase
MNPARPFRLAAATLLAAAALRAAAPTPPAEAAEIPLWSGTAPGSETEKLPRPDFAEVWSGEPGKRGVRQTTAPTFHVFLPPPAKANGAALVVAPGGGYNIVMLEPEGWLVARRLAAEGTAVFVLKYRHWNRELALHDARRAVRTVRTRAAEWGIDPRRVGLGGFSAGGNLALNAAANPAAGEPAPADAIDRADPRPDFLMLIYPTPISRLPEGATVDGRFPATFIVCAVEDNADERVLPLSAALLKARIRHEAHVFATGAHGFGLAADLPGTAVWPALFTTWLGTQLAPAGGMAEKFLPPAQPWGAKGGKQRPAAK